MQASFIFTNRVLLKKSHRLTMSSTSEAHSKGMGNSLDGNVNGGGGGGGDRLQGMSCPSQEKGDAGFYAEEERDASPRKLFMEDRTHIMITGIRPCI